MKEFIASIYDSRSVVGRSGQVHELTGEIDRREGEFLFSIINDDSTIRRTLEVGCAYGLSSLHICSATRERPGASHMIIDPFQNTRWDGAGIVNLEAGGIDFFALNELKSEIALPKLLEKNEGQFDFIFIDGWHTFDHTLLDCFYATRLLKVGGVLAIDDVSFPSGKRVCNYLRNYPCYQQIGHVGIMRSKSWKRVVARLLCSPISEEAWSKILSRTLYRRIFEDEGSSMVALRKFKEDNRNWDWHNDDF